MQSNRIRLKLVLAAPLLAAVLLVCLAAPPGPRAHAGEPPPSGPALQSAEEQLAQKYAPIVYSRDQREACDTRGSPYYPVPVEFVFDQQQIVLRRFADGVATEVARGPVGTDLYGLDDTYYLDFPGNPRRPGCTFERDFLARAEAYPATAYAHIAYEEGRDGFALQYWFYYYFNHWNNTHEGDWEMIQLTFDGPTPADALDQEPSGVGYSQHGSGERGSWNDDKLTKEGNRPVAYAAAGANASQFEQNMILGRGDNGTGFGCDDARPPSRRYETRAVLVEEPESASSAFPWLGYDGRWGERVAWEFNGPTGPNDKLAWDHPFTWQERLRPSSIIVPTRDVLGVDVVNAFCDGVWYLSTPLIAIVHFVPTWLILTIASIPVLGLTYVASRGTYRPVSVEPLRQRRHFGQVLRASWRVYLQHLPIFLAVGVLYVPAGVILAGAQSLVAKTPFVETLLGYFPGSLLAQALFAMAFGGVGAGILYWFVIALSVAAVARIDRRANDEAGATYREVIAKFGTIIVPRALAIAKIVLLVISVIGIPWAIRNVFRWVFIEQAVLFDGAGRDEATRVSERAVDGNWWHAARCLVVLSLIVLVVGPALALILLLWFQTGVAAVNLTSSAVFAALTPFVGIAESLVYFDLKERRAARDAGGAG